MEATYVDDFLLDKPCDFLKWHFPRFCSKILIFFLVKYFKLIFKS